MSPLYGIAAIDACAVSLIRENELANRDALGPVNFVTFAEIPAKRSGIEMQLPFGATQIGGDLIR